MIGAITVDIYLLIMFVVISTVTFYATHLFLPEKKNYKYGICSLFILFGVITWLYVWFGNGWLTAAVYGTVSIMLGVILFIIALFFDMLDKKKRIKA
jgi:hypothetical protein